LGILLGIAAYRTYPVGFTFGHLKCQRQLRQRSRWGIHGPGLRFYLGTDAYNFFLFCTTL
jgi:hypothetical protein